jgi:hypothetical protein
MKKIRIAILVVPALGLGLALALGASSWGRKILGTIGIGLYSVLYTVQLSLCSCGSRGWNWSGAAGFLRC